MVLFRFCVISRRSHFQRGFHSFLPNFCIFVIICIFCKKMSLALLNAHEFRFFAYLRKLDVHTRLQVSNALLGVHVVSSSHEADMVKTSIYSVDRQICYKAQFLAGGHSLTVVREILETCQIGLFEHTFSASLLDQGHIQVRKPIFNFRLLSRVILAPRPLEQAKQETQSPGDLKNQGK